MKSVIATAGLFAIANAYQPLNFHYRRQNDSYPVPVPAPVSSEAPAGFTTLTVEVTEVATITSCKPTITNCPAVSNALPEEDLEVVVVTNTVVLTEVVCPITEVESISSAVIKEHETGSLPGSTRTEPAATASSALPTIQVPYPGVPLSTAPAAPVTTSAALPVPGEEYVTEIDDVETTATLTLTLGRGESATVVESVITTTFQTTVVKTITACPGGCEGGDKPPSPTGNYPVPGGSEGESEDDVTTTTTATTTGTKTITVQPPNKTNEESSPEASSPVGAEGGVPGTCSGSGEQCQCPSAVTVTIPASTVYVTIGGAQPTAAADSDAGSGNGSNNGGSGSNDEDSGNSPVTGEDDEDVDAEEDDCPAEDDEDVDEDNCDADEEGDDEDDCDAEDDVVVVSQTVTVEPVPYPTGSNNGTLPSGVAAPTSAAAPVPTAAPAYPIYRRFI